MAFYTSSVIKEDVMRGVERGSTYFIPKPFGVSSTIELARTIDFCLANDLFNCERLDQLSLKSTLSLNSKIA